MKKQFGVFSKTETQNYRGTPLFHSGNVLHVTENETSFPDVGTHLRGSILHNRDWKQLGCSLAGELRHCGRSIQWSIMQP